MTSDFSAQSLFSQYGSTFALQWRAGQDNAARLLDARFDSEDGRPLIAFLNPIRNPVVQVLGLQELQYLQLMANDQERLQTLKPLLDSPLILIVSDDQDIPTWLQHWLDVHQIPAFTTPWRGSQLIRDLRHFLTLHLASAKVLHGVFLEVLGSGVFIRGSSGIGKSELALELISRGHRLIADDAPIFRRAGPDVLNGKSPEALTGFLEVRGLGVLDIRAMFGENAIKPNKNLKMIIHLVPMESLLAEAIDRLEGHYGEEKVLEVPIPCITLPVAPGRNMAVLVEGAVRNFQLRAGGYNSSQAFIDRQQAIIQRGES